MRHRALFLLAVATLWAPIGCGDSSPGAEGGRSQAASESKDETGAGAGGAAAAASVAGPRRALDLSGPGWMLALDREAAWEDDALHLPGVDVATLPARAPAGGWEALVARGQAVSVPGTVEEHVWEDLAAARRAEADGAAAAPGEPDTLGDYVGVSWWARDLDVPAEWLAPRSDAPGGPAARLPRRIALHFDAVRLRAEVFLNERLVGYDAVGNTPFEVDVTDAVRAGRNRLAVRVTDPGGNFDWIDYEAHRWGSAPEAQTIPASHGFGGVTGPVRLVVTDAVQVSDVFVRNEADPTAVTVLVTVRNETAEPRAVALELELCPGGQHGLEGEPGGGEVAGAAQGGERAGGEASHAHGTLRVLDLALGAPPGESVHEQRMQMPGIALWSPQQPALHRVRVRLFVPDGAVTIVNDGRSPIDPQQAFGPPADVVEQRFGFRSFTVEGVGEDALFRLNGERIVLRSAISWGFWPITGLVPIPALARRQVQSAKDLGLNMLNHHRTIAAPGLLDVQDELGLLAHCEPGGYTARGGDALCHAFAREKLLRMIRRDRSHPSVVIWNLINEELAAPDERHRADMAAARALDPSRVITFTSGWAKDGDDPTKLHWLPASSSRTAAGAAAADGEPPFRTQGWWDYHNAPGPGVWRDRFWKGPQEHLRRSTNRAEIVFWGEEGAIAAPPRLERVAQALWPRRNAGQPLGWDGHAYLVWRRAWEQWLAARNETVREAASRGGAAAAGGPFAPLDALTESLGGVALDYQARTLENVRLGDVADAYVVNGWESEPLENHSGIVDIWRNPKGPAERLARAAAPSALVVKLRESVLPAGEWLSPDERGAVKLVADVGLVDETARAGPHRLRLALRDGAGAVRWSEEREVRVSGGDVFGELLAEDVLVLAALEPGLHRLEAELSAAGEGGATLAGFAELFVVDWRSQALPVDGALLEQGNALTSFFERAGREPPPVFHDGLPPLAYVLVGDIDPEPRDTIPASAFSHRAGEPAAEGAAAPGLVGSYFQGADFAGEPVLRRVDARLDMEWSLRGPEGDDAAPATLPVPVVAPIPVPPVAVPGPAVPTMAEGPPPSLPAGGPLLGRTDYLVRWEGTLTAPQDGDYLFHLLSDDGARLWLDDELLVDDWESHGARWRGSAPVRLAARGEHTLRLEYRQTDGAATLRLAWTTPARAAAAVRVARELLRRAREDGTTAVFLHRADAWAARFAALGAVQTGGRLEHGRYWVGGGFFARPHPLLAGLPAGGALGWPWQELVHYGAERYGIRLAGEEAVIGCFSDHQYEPATALGIVRAGKGRLLFSTLDILRTVNGPPGPADVVRKLLVNVVAWAGTTRS